MAKPVYRLGKGETTMETDWKNPAHEETKLELAQLKAQRDELANMLQRIVDECSHTRVAPEGILTSAPPWRS